MIVKVETLIKNIRAAVKRADAKNEKLKKSLSRKLPGQKFTAFDEALAELSARRLVQSIKLKKLAPALTALRKLPLDIEDLIIRHGHLPKMGLDDFFHFNFSEFRPGVKMFTFRPYNRKDLKSTGVAAMVYDVCRAAGLKPTIHTAEELAYIYLKNIYP